MGHHEVEIKRLLCDGDAAERLIAALGAPVRAEKRQVNNIFDTAGGHLARSHHTLRLRTEGERAYLTAKGPGRAVSATTASRMEAEIELEPELVDELLAGAIEPVTLLRSRETDEAYSDLWRSLDEARECRVLRPAGRFENLRRVVDVVLPDGLELTVEIDRTAFPGGRIDNEIEIELPDESLVAEVEGWIDQITEEAGIRTTTSSPKLRRFYEARDSGSA